MPPPPQIIMIIIKFTFSFLILCGKLHATDKIKARKIIAKIFGPKYAARLTEQVSEENNR